LPGQVSKYTAVATTDRLHQGEVIAGLVCLRQSLNSIGTAEIAVDEITQPFLIVLTQDCDLAQDAEARSIEKRAADDQAQLNDPDFKRRFENASKLKIQNVLFCEAMPTSEMKLIVPSGKDIWKRIIQNKDERYHCLESVPAGQDMAGQGMPSLGCDFKRFLTISTDDVYRRFELNQGRRTRLLTPYVEHLLHRFCHFQARIPLPENHDIAL